MAAAPAGVALWAFGPLAAVGSAAAVGGLELWRVRKAIHSAVPETLAFVPSRPVDHPWLDADGFRDALAALEAKGFRPIADYAVAYPNAPEGFARVAVNPELRIYAEVNQVRQRGHITHVTTALTSMLDDDWSLQTTTQEPFAVMVAFMCAERSVWRSLPGASAADLLADHLTLRTQMMSDLGVRIAGDGTLERYFEVQQRAHEGRKSTLTKTNVLKGIARGVAAERKPRREWFGAYTPSRSAG